MKFKVYIPARYASSRLPGKPLLTISGKTIIQHVYENALSSGADEVIVATDDQRIADVALGFGAAVAMTARTHESGTDRVAEAVSNRDEADGAIIVNVQGDEPQLPAGVIRQVADTLAASAAAQIATVCEPILLDTEIDNPNIVKVVRTSTQRAMYFSRSPIPCARDDRSDAQGTYYRHVGIYAYRAAYLRRFVATPVAPLERVERLEQLRALANDDVIVVADAVAECGFGVDTNDDYERLCKHWGRVP